MTELLIQWLIRCPDDVRDPHVRQRYGMLAGGVGIFCNFLLAAVKLTLGMLTGAVSILADAINNLSDAFSSVVTIVGFRLSGRSADREHPYGHGRIEYVSGFIVSSLVIAVALDLLKTSIEKILHRTPIDVDAATIVLMALAIVVKLWMAVFYHKVGRRIASKAMDASATDSLTDCITTGAALFSVCVMLFTGHNIDGWVGALVAVVVAVSGLRSACDMLTPLLGTAPEEGLIREIGRHVEAQPQILGTHDLRVHEYGPGHTIASFHAELPSSLTLMQAHEIVDALERDLIAQGVLTEVTIHIDPMDTEDTEAGTMREEVAAIVREVVEGGSIHDFRVTYCDGARRIRFDVLAPYDCGMEDALIQRKVCAALKERYPEDSAEITVDRG